MAQVPLPHPLDKGQGAFSYVHDEPGCGRVPCRITFVVNPQATGGSFVLANGAQSTYNALIIDLRHRPSHGLQFDVNYSFAKSLTNYKSTARSISELHHSAKPRIR